LESIGVELVGVPIEPGGINLDAVRTAVRAGAKAIIIQPRAQNPSGISTTPAQVKELAAIVRGADTLVVEDDSSAAISTSPAVSVGMWVPERTVYIRSFSKSYGPDLRLAALSGPAEVLDAIAARRQLGQGWSSRLLQRILYNLLTDEPSVRQVERARAEYARRIAAVADELDQHDVRVVGRDGINLWVPVHDEAAAIVRLATQGIGVAPGQPFATIAGQAPHIRVTAGRIAKHHAELATAIAAAARTQHWGRGIR
jgi:DNA-binding transcriptional MocR family regulator